jgi:WD40 repeat protein
MGALLLTLEEHTDRVACCAFSPDGKRILTASWDETVRFWDAETGAPQRTLEGHKDRGQLYVLTRWQARRDGELG